MRYYKHLNTKRRIKNNNWKCPAITLNDCDSPRGIDHLNKLVFGAFKVGHIVTLLRKTVSEATRSKCRKSKIATTALQCTIRIEADGDRNVHTPGRNNIRLENDEV